MIKIKIPRILLVIVVVLRVISYFLPIEWVNSNIQSLTRIGFNSLILIVFGGYVVTQIWNVRSETLFIKIFSTFLTVILLFLMEVLIVLVGYMCAEVTVFKHFIHKDKNSEIVSRTFDCGATTSIDSKDFEVIQLTKLSNDLQIVTKVDTNQIDKREWVSQ
ncbi:MAG: hypothetical protein U0Y10_24990 [Spirosomataceae bacterium]